MTIRWKKKEAVLGVLKLRSEHLCYGSFLFIDCQEAGGGAYCVLQLDNKKEVTEYGDSAMASLGRT